MREEPVVENRGVDREACDRVSKVVNVRNRVRKCGDHLQLIASYDGFYLTQGHYSNNSSGMLHDYSIGDVAWFTPQEATGTTGRVHRMALKKTCSMSFSKR